MLVPDQHGCCPTTSRMCARVRSGRGVERRNKGRGCPVAEEGRASILAGLKFRSGRLGRGRRGESCWAVFRAGQERSDVGRSGWC